MWHITRSIARTKTYITEVLLYVKSTAVVMKSEKYVLFADEMQISMNMKTFSTRYSKHGLNKQKPNSYRSAALFKNYNSYLTN